jgi:hypothetical protein
MYFGEMPSCTNWLSVGVRFRYRKSARKPSSDISIVVGAKREVPFETRVVVKTASWLSDGLESRYTSARRMKKNPVIEVYMHTRRHRLERVDCEYC